MINYNKNPLIVGSTEGNCKQNHKYNYTLVDRKREFDRSRLPKPSIYYARQFPKTTLKFRSNWATVKCCFHVDNNPSLRINQQYGHFRCFSCNAKGHDVLAFHQLRYGMSFIEAVTALGAWSNG